MQKIKRFNKLIIASVIALIFVITIFASLPSKVYASEVEAVSDTSDIINDKYSDLVLSNNLYNGSKSFEGELWARDITDISSFINSMPAGVYSLSLDITNLYLIDTDNLNGCFTFLDIVDLDNNNENISFSGTIDPHNVGDTYRLYLTFTVKENVNYMFKVWGCGNHEVGTVGYVKVDNIMINKGSTALPYEPYINGSMIYQEAYNQGYNDAGSKLDNAIYNAFNDSTCSLFYKDELIISSSIFIERDSLFLSISNFDEIYDYLYDDESGYKYTLLIKLGASINNELVFDLNNTLINYEVVLSNSISGYSCSFERPSSSLYTLICNTNGEYYDCISIYPLYPPDYIDFKMNINIGQLSYNAGYNVGFENGHFDGYNDGLFEGFNDGYDKGYVEGTDFGYDKGYTEGKEYGFANAGDLGVLPKNFINAMFSTPINIFKSLLNWEFFGINLFGVLTSLLTIAVVVFLFRKFKK